MLQAVKPLRYVLAAYVSHSGTCPQDFIRGAGAEGEGLKVTDLFNVSGLRYCALYPAIRTIKYYRKGRYPLFYGCGRPVLIPRKTRISLCIHAVIPSVLPRTIHAPLITVPRKAHVSSN